MSGANHVPDAGKLVMIAACPFCGYAGQWEGKGAWRIVCSNVTCGASGPTALYANEALIGWNHRESTPAPDKLDAATVERCAQDLWGYDYQGQMYRLWATEPEAAKEGYRKRVRVVAAALATDPHQHGGKGA